MGVDFGTCHGCKDTFCLNGGYIQCSCDKIYCLVCRDYAKVFLVHDEKICSHCNPYNSEKEYDNDELLEYALKLLEMTRIQLNSKMNEELGVVKTLECEECGNKECEDLLDNEMETDVWGFDSTSGYCCKCVKTRACVSCATRFM